MAEVGLALAIFPLIISAAENFRKLYQPIARYRKFAVEAVALHSRLMTQREIYRLSSIRLLRQAVSKDDAEDMIDDEFHELWKDPVRISKLEKAIYRSKEPIASTVQQITHMLKEIMQTEKEWASALKSKLSKENDSGIKNWKENISQKLKFSFSSPELEKKMNLLRTLIGEYQTLVELSIKNNSDSRRSKRAQEPLVDLPKRYARVGNAANRLCEALGNCMEHTDHKTMMNLASTQATHLSVRFELAFCFGSSPDDPLWFAVESPAFNEYHNDVDMDVHDGHKPSAAHTLADRQAESNVSDTRDKRGLDFGSQEPERKRIKSIDLTPRQLTLTLPRSKMKESLTNSHMDKKLCAKIYSHYYLPESEPAESSVGPLEDKNGRKHRVYISRPPSLRSTARRKTLADILEQVKDQDSNIQLSHFGRLRIARILATAVLRFHDTPWLKNGLWTSRDICIFCCDQSFDQALRRAHPFIESSLRNPRNTHPDDLDSRSRPYIRNALLFGLGVVLVELAFQKPLIDMQSTSEQFPGTNSSYGEYLAANRLSNNISSKLGMEYKRVVQKLLYCDFGEGAEMSDLKLQERYYTHVVRELSYLEETLYSRLYQNDA